MDTLKNIDYQLFRIINGSNNRVLDFLMYWISDKWIWLPLYIWVFYMLIRYMGKKLIWFALLTGGLIALSDQLSVYIKFFFQRLRPCHDPQLVSTIHLVNSECGGQYGFLSSHASNTMTLVLLLSAILPSQYNAVKIRLLIYLIIVGYSRIYLGAHFPGDIIAGWMLGIFVACIGILIWKKFAVEKQKTL
jgi:undecaprenyl-diphosphatase